MRADDVYGWPRKTDLACVGDRDAAGHSAARTVCGGSTVYADRVGEVHVDGEIRSRGPFGIRGALGARTVDRIIVKAQFGFRVDTDCARALLLPPRAVVPGR
ncbi:hypothetical protein GCM10010347_37550 [Streptomyces cirratus]|uniref:Uncharacterized protein n=1 Tax=Streptomyces cirratus TaxID=68187 RepID=A0ABQ3EV90_9ACTN|nr:hypothetical protein [Streptomyces cirratus]GHB64024.1 hypothetical protein GCM10010347_37550 [Streptomyces cirratus]